DALAAKIAQAPHAVPGAHQHGGAVDEGERAEIDQLPAREGLAGGAAFEVHLALAHRLEPVLDGERHPARLELLELQAAAQLARDALAQLDRVALRLHLAHEREGQRAVDVAKRYGPGLADPVEGRRLREAAAREDPERECEPAFGHCRYGSRGAVTGALDLGPIAGPDGR